MKALSVWPFRYTTPGFPSHWCHHLEQSTLKVNGWSQDKMSTCFLKGQLATKEYGGKTNSDRAAFTVTAIQDCGLEAEDTERRGPVTCVITCSQRNHIIISEGDSGQTFHLKTVIVQMFNYFSNAKDDCKFVICPIGSYQPQPPWVTGKKNILHRKLTWFDHFVFKMIFLSSLWLCSLILFIPQGRFFSERPMAQWETASVLSLLSC